MIHDRRGRALVEAASAPQPPPGGGGEEVFLYATELVAWDRALVDALFARSEKGQAKYRQPLKTRDGRNSTHEQLQKSLDGYVYAVKDMLEGPGSLDVVAAWLRVLLTVAARVDGSRTTDRRAVALALANHNLTSEQIGLVLGCHPVTVRRWRGE